MCSDQLLRTAAGIALAAALAGCGGQPVEYHSQNEIPEGPGMFTGEKGAAVFTLWERKTTADATPAATDQKQRSATAGAAAGQSAADTMGTPGGARAGAAGDYAEFEAFQQFRRMKESRSAEYREFLEWREWKEYREWRRQREPGK